MVDISAYITDRPRLVPPPGACDCHFHIFGPGSHYPFAAGGERNLHPDASVDQCRALFLAMGIERGIVVQPSAYGTDNRRTVDAVRELGIENFRGTIICTPSISDAELGALHANGMRGIRVAYPSADIDFADLPALATRVAPLGWMIQMSGSAAPDWLARNPGMPVPMMIDHMARMPVGTGVNDPAFVDVLRLLEQDNIWLKLSGPYYTSAVGAPFTDVVARVRALAAARPDRLVWATNWPHPQYAMDDKPDAAACLDLLLDAVPDAAVRQAILCDNPARLYGFAA